MQITTARRQWNTHIKRPNRHSGLGIEKAALVTSVQWRPTGGFAYSENNRPNRGQPLYKEFLVGFPLHGRPWVKILRENQLGATASADRPTPPRKPGRGRTEPGRHETARVNQSETYPSGRRPRDRQERKLRPVSRRPVVVRTEKTKTVNNIITLLSTETNTAENVTRNGRGGRTKSTSMRQSRRAS